LSQPKQKGSYVWDDWSDNEDEPNTAELEKSSSIFDGKSVSSLGLESLQEAEMSTSVRTMASEISEKVERMRRELRGKSSTCKQLQSELQRLKLARERRTEKSTNKWEEQLAITRQGHDDALRKLQEFHHRLQKDVTKLEFQWSELEKRKSLSQANQEAILERTKQDADRRKARAKRQWEADEKSSFEKVLRGKADVMERQAAASLGPRIDKLVAEGKAKVVQVREDGEITIQKLQLTLNADHEKKVNECREALASQVTQDVEKVRRQLHRKHDERQKAHLHEISSLQDKHSRDRRQLDDSYERTQKIEEDQNQEAEQALSKRETQQVQELMDRHQRELGYLTQAHDDALHQLRTALREQEVQGQQCTMQLRSQLREQQLQRRKQGITRRIATETERILQKLREDAAIEREHLQRSLAEEVNSVRDRIQTQIESHQDDEQKNLSRVATLQAEIHSFSSQINRLEQATSISQQAMREDLTPSLSSLRKEMRDVEADYEQLQPRHEKLLDRRRLEAEEEIKSLQEQLQNQQLQTTEQLKVQSDEKEKLQQEYVVELTRIKDKVSGLLHKKTLARSELSARLQQSKKKSSELQDTLEDLRNSTFEGKEAR